MQKPNWGARRTGRRAPLHLAACLCLLLIHAIARGQATSIDTVLERADAAQSAGRYTEAIDAYTQAVAINPRIPELWANLGLMQHLAGRYIEAAKSFTRALALKPALFMPQLFLGLDQLELGKPEAAVLHLERARALHPDDPKVAIGLGRANTALHRPRVAATAYTSATKNDAANQSAWYGLGVASIALIEQDGGTLATHAPDSVWARILYADDLLQQGRTNEALDTYRKVVGIACTAERKTLLDTLKAASAAGALKNISLETQHRLFTIFEAPAEIAPSCTRSSARIAAHQQMASLYWQNQPNASADAAAQRIQVAPSDYEALFWSVKANERRASDALARFTLLAPESAETYDLLGDLDRRRMQPDSALERYEKALTLSPHDPPALLGRAAALLSIGRFDEAVMTAKQAIDDKPEDARLNLLMGEALVARHSYPEAEPYLKKAIAASTGSLTDASLATIAPRAYALKGRIEAETGHTDQAIADMTRGLPSDQDGTLSFQLSRLYRRAGRLNEATQAEANAKSLQAQRLAHAVTAVQSAQSAPNTEVNP